MIKVKTKIKTWIETDDNKIFNVGSDIAFDYYEEESDKQIHVICEIMDIIETAILAKNVEINKKLDKNYKLFRIANMSNVNYVYYD